jgi:RNA polymerase sigma-70 factor (ECF subfamily)
VDDVEAAIREAHQRGDFQTAAQRGLEQYKIEVYSFLYARLRSEVDAHEVFGQLGEDIWRGIAAFEWRCSFRTWLYTLARHAALRFERAPTNRARERLSQVSEPVAVPRSRTRPYMRTDIKDRFAAVRETLSADEQSLLTLRIDRNLSWEEVARIMYDGDDCDDATLARHATNLRQRFRKLRQRLQAWARQEGILDGE